MNYTRQYFNSSSNTWSGSRKVAAGIDGNNAAADNCWQPVPALGKRKTPEFVCSPLKIVAERHDNNDPGSGSEYLIPLGAKTRLADLAHHIDSACDFDHFRHPMPGNEGRVQPFEA